MKVDINLQKVDIDQCSSDGWFSGTHRCHLNNSEVRMKISPEIISSEVYYFWYIVFICVCKWTRGILLGKKIYAALNVAKWTEKKE